MNSHEIYESIAKNEKAKKKMSTVLGVSIRHLYHK